MTTNLSIRVSCALDLIRKFAFAYPFIPNEPRIIIVFSLPAHTIAVANQDSLQVMRTEAQGHQSGQEIVNTQLSLHLVSHMIGSWHATV